MSNHSHNRFLILNFCLHLGLQHEPERACSCLDTAAAAILRGPGSFYSGTFCYCLYRGHQLHRNHLQPKDHTVAEVGRNNERTKLGRPFNFAQQIVEPAQRLHIQDWLCFTLGAQIVEHMPEDTVTKSSKLFLNVLHTRFLHQGKDEGEQLAYKLLEKAQMDNFRLY
jgi:hypothetical protein